MDMEQSLFQDSDMRFSILPIFLLAIILSGCAQNRELLPPGEDADRLAAAIAHKGSEPPQTDDSNVPNRNVIGPVLKTGAKVGETCAVIGTAAAYAIASKSPSITSSPLQSNNDNRSGGVSNTLHKIWSGE
jgi:hypothetical protein